MFSDIITLFFGIMGIIFVLLSFVFKLITWREESFNFVIPLYSDNENIFTKICNITDFVEFSGIHKKCTIVIVNYGASDYFCNQLDSYFKNCINLKIVKATSQAANIFKELHT